MRIGRLLATLLCWVVVPTMSHAARAVAPDATIHVRLQVGQQTLLIFPEPIETVSLLTPVNAEGKAVDDGIFSASTYGFHLVVVANDASVQKRFFVFGRSGTPYEVVCKVANPPDTIIRITTVASKGDGKAPAFESASFLRALRLNKMVPGQQDLPEGGPMITDSRVTIVGRVTRQVGPLIGTTLVLKNTSAVPVVLDERLRDPASVSNETTLSVNSWSWPPHFEVTDLSLENPLLLPNAETRLHIVFQKGR